MDSYCLLAPPHSPAQQPAHHLVLGDLMEVDQLAQDLELEPRPQDPEPATGPSGYIKVAPANEPAKKKKRLGMSG